MRILERAVYRGPHLYSATPMVRIMLDLEELESSPTDTVPTFTAWLLRILPGLEQHGCSYHRPGGFVTRLNDGTWIGHVIEHVALELQCLAGSPVTRGKTRSVPGRPGVYNVMYAYNDSDVALLAGRLAIELVASLLPLPVEVHGLELLADATPAESEPDAIPGLGRLTDLVNRSRLGPTTQAIVDAARRRGIPRQRLDTHSLVRLGYGSRQRTFRASITDGTSHLAVERASDKQLTKSLLGRAGIPVPRGTIAHTAKDVTAAIHRIGGPVVTKPLDGNHGRGVTVGILNPDAAQPAFDVASRASCSGRVIVEEQLPGNDYRVLVVGGKAVAVAERVPAHVVGDGVRTVLALIDRLNADPRRGTGHERVMTRVAIDDQLLRVIRQQGFELDDVPAAGRTVVLRDTANLSTGGEAIDRTDDIHPDNAAAAERAAAIIGLDIAGIDIVCRDIARPLRETGGGIIEVNAAPGFRMHLQPSQGKARDVGAAVIDLLYPPRHPSRIPIIAVTGTNGKSTTVRMIAHILAATGQRVGMTTTTGIYIDGRLTQACDASGPRSARTVLADPTVDAAVLETARGGILREGLGFDVADVGVVLNVTGDHLGLGGVTTLEQLAAVKSVVAESVRRRGASVLNADDPLTAAMARHAGGRVVYFTMHGADAGADAQEHVREHLAAGGILLAFEPSPDGGMLVVHDGGVRTPLLRATEVPATVGGGAKFNIENALAAAAATYALGVDVEVIVRALRTFESSYELNPGRLNITRAPGFTAILDYGHNAAALRAVGDLINKLRPQHRRVIGVVSTPGDRRDQDIEEMGAIAAGIFDDVVFRELPDGRGRAEGGVIALLTKGALGAGMSPHHLRRVPGETEAMDAALRMAGPDDLVVLMPTNVDAVWQQIMSFRARSAETSSVPPGAQPPAQLPARPPTQIQTPARPQAPAEAPLQPVPPLALDSRG